MRRLTAATWLLVGSVGACGGSDEPAAGATAGAGGEANLGGAAGASGAGGAPRDNQAPSWEEAPASPVVAGQGRTVVVAVTTTDPEGDAVEVTVSAPDDVEATVSKQGLALRPSYQAEGERAVTVTPDRRRGGLTVLHPDAGRAAPALARPGDVGGERPDPREHATVVGGKDGSVYVFQGGGYSPYGEVLDDGWRFDPTTRSWAKVTLTGDVPPALGSRRAAGVPGSGTAYLFGGYDGDQALSNDLYRVDAEADTLTFTKVAQQTPPPRRSLFAFGYDEVSHRFALFGGAASAAILGDTWTMELDTSGQAVWTKLKTDKDSSPGTRFGAFYGLEPSTGRLVVFSGQTSYKNEFASDSWALDLRATPPSWARLQTAGDAPPGRRNGTSVLDPDGPRLFVTGGTSDGKTTQPGLFVLDLRPGSERWTPLSLPQPPDDRSSGFGIALGHHVWMGFGNTINKTYRDWSSLGDAPDAGTGGAGGQGGAGGSAGDGCGEATDCPSCCVDVHTTGYDAFAASTVAHCACDAGSPCTADCQASACAQQPPSSDCVACINKLGPDAPCKGAVSKDCQASPDCVALVSCSQSCP